jgi:hypothetical protein
MNGGQATNAAERKTTACDTEHCLFLNSYNGVFSTEKVRENET